MKTVELGKSEHWGKLDFLVGSIMGLSVILNDEGQSCWLIMDSASIGESYRYSPTTNASQCYTATPSTEVSYEGDGVSHFYACKNSYCTGEYKEQFYWSTHRSELVARCLALVHAFHGEDVGLSKKQ